MISKFKVILIEYLISTQKVIIRNWVKKKKITGIYHLLVK